MPHFILEYSDNILEEIKPKDLFQKLHRILVENGPFKLSDIKSRSIEHKDFYISDGNESNAFVHLTLSIFKGRNLSVRQTVGKMLLEFLKKEFARSYKQLRCSITVEIRASSWDSW